MLLMSTCQVTTGVAEAWNNMAGLPGTTRQLVEEAGRAMRHPEGKVAVVLHLSRLEAPRDYHVRVARVLLQDTAQRHGGQVFTLPDRDLILICRQSQGGRNAPAELPSHLAQLFSADVPCSSELTSFWELDREPTRIHDYLLTKSRSPTQRSASPPWGGSMQGQPASLAALTEIITRAPLTGLLTKQIGVALPLTQTGGRAARLAPAYQPIGIELKGLSLDPMVRHALADPYLGRHFAATLDSRLIQLLRNDLLRQGRLLRPAAHQALPVLLELSLPTISSPEFATMVRLAAGAGVRFWIGVALLDAVASPELFEHASQLLKLLDCRLVLHSVDPLTLNLFDTNALQPEFLVLAWSPLLQQTWSGRRLSGLPRLILRDVDGEPAIGWGQANGIDLFQGPFLSQIQAALRMQGCHSAGQCTLLQCAGRASAMAVPGRAGCANPSLLDSGSVTPSPGAVAA